jgi:WhiB family redox-sensing transcriptional regulator
MATGLHPLAAPRRPDWIDRAACRSADPELFHPVATTGRRYECQVEDAKGICLLCPVRTRCLQTAIQVHATGIWGGTTDDERVRLVRVLGR